MIVVIAPRPYKKKARAQSQQRTRDALLDVANEEFYEGRWEKTSLEKLANKAGVTKQTLLRHFNSKEGLLMHTLMRTYFEVNEQRSSVPTGDIEGAVENLLDHYEAWGKRSLRIGAWLEGGNPLLAKISKGAREYHYNWVEHAFARWLSQLDDHTRRHRRDALITLCDVHAWWLLSHDLGLDRAAICATLTEAIEGVLGVRN
ncbi:MAG TPA: TetR/AcrR family transcriptional regulator [Solirubrobacteraceae bacterium]|nr:TetR/AcrR family transcriptional regulator [Solirubrobacteraceae bacterium]